MPGGKLSVAERVVSESKIRKRGWSSSSSSSSLVRSYRLKRAILAGKKGGSSTPVPTWKMDPKSPPPCVRQNAKSMQYPSSKDLSVSARKLAATLWEINEVSPPQKQGILESKNVSNACSLLPQQFSPAHDPDLKSLNRSKASGVRRRAIPPQLEAVDSIHNPSSIVEIDAESHGRSCNRHSCAKTRLKDISSGLTASKELLRVLNRIWTKEEKNSSIQSLVSALRFELDRARVQVDQLIHEQRSNRYEVDYLLRKFAEEKVSWKNKEQDKVRNAVSSIAGELGIEKKLRRQSERLNKKLGRELADTKESLSKALKEAENEKRAREILEQVCDELARGIGEDRAQVEEIKRDSAKVREEVEKEREMLQLADVLREERVQMKLSEAKYEYEEKNAVVDKLRSELEAYLSTTRMGEENKGTDASPSFNRIKELEEYLRKTLGTTCQNGERKYNEGEVLNGREDEGEDSADSDLQSIELNVDNTSNSYNWGYARTDVDTKFDLRRGSMDEKPNGRRSTSDRNQKRRSLSLEGRNSDAIEWDFSVKSQENTEGFDRGRLLELASQAWRKEKYGDEVERYEMLRDLRDHILSATSKASSSQGFASSKTPIGT